MNKNANIYIAFGCQGWCVPVWSVLRCIQRHPTTDHGRRSGRVLYCQAAPETETRTVF